MPGSPPSNDTEPATNPPPSTRSISGSPVGTATNRALSTAAIDCGRVSADEGADEGADDADSTSSTSVFHSPHALHRPPHCGLPCPHWRHMKPVRDLAMTPP